MSAVHSAALDLTQLEFFPLPSRQPRHHVRITDTDPIPTTQAPAAVLALRQVLELDVEDEHEVEEQGGFDFPYDFTWVANNLFKMQEQLLKHHSHLLRDERTTAESWLEIILWFIASFEPPERCSQFSLQACCEAFTADFHTVREGIVHWIAAALKPPGRVKEGSFQAHCELRELDARALRERLIRRFEPTLLKALR